MTIRSLCYQIDIDSICLSDLFNRCVHQDKISKVIPMLTKLIEIYSTEWIKYIKDFLLRYFP